jgi:HAD superfamily hydrolase (TIGR01509 family)
MSPPRFAPRALILDMDGLMVDSEPLWFRVERDFAAARGGLWTEELAAPCIGRGIRNTLSSMREEFVFDLDPERDAAEIIDRFIARVPELELKRGCAALLDEARGNALLALASSSPARLIDAVLTRFGIAPRFDAVVSGEAVAHPKPAPDIFLEAARRLGVKPEHCLVLEDSLAGVTAGRAAGMAVIAVPEGELHDKGFERVADAIAQDLEEARGWIDLDARIGRD